MPSTSGNFKILFTGASSFSGMHFVEAAHRRGAEVTATFTRASPGEYEDALVRKRIEQILPLVRPLWKTPFGSPSWLNHLKVHSHDLLCCHGAVVGNYKDQAYPVESAVKANTLNLDASLRWFKKKGGWGVILTGSYFEPNEGAGSLPLKAFSPYGEAKSLTAHAFQQSCKKIEMVLVKYVLPNPFGPLEKSNFSSYLAKSWLQGMVPQVQTPNTVRDNIPVFTLASDYADFIQNLKKGSATFQKRNPSGWIESNFDFGRRLARELAPRLGVSCPLAIAPGRQHCHPPGEPPVRHNTDTLDTPDPRFWDELACDYLERFGPSPLT